MDASGDIGVLEAERAEVVGVGEGYAVALYVVSEGGVGEMGFHHPCPVVALGLPALAVVACQGRESHGFVGYDAIGGGVGDDATGLGHNPQVFAGVHVHGTVEGYVNPSWDVGGSDAKRVGFQGGVHKAVGVAFVEVEQVGAGFVDIEAHRVDAASSVFKQEIGVETLSPVGGGGLGTVVFAVRTGGAVGTAVTHHGLGCGGFPGEAHGILFADDFAGEVVNHGALGIHIHTGVV